MNLKLFSFAITNYSNEDPLPTVRAKLNIVFSDFESKIGGSIDVDFEHENPGSLTFDQVELIAIDKAKAAL